MVEAWNVVEAAAVSMAGAVAIMITLSKFLAERAAERWFEGVKSKYAERLAHVEHELGQLGKRTQAHLDHAITVSRAQFEEEFRSLREVWKCVARSRAAATGIAEGTVPLNDTPDQRMERFFEARNRLAVAQAELVQAIDNNSPFYPQEIYRVVDSFRTRTALELMRLRTTEPFHSDWYDARIVASSEILELAESVSASIRQRLGSIVIQELPTATRS
jgi:hypothetical protein